MSRADAVPGARDLAISAALDAGAILRQMLRGARSIDYKGAVDLVTDADRAAEATIEERLRPAFPEFRFIGEEESGASGSLGQSPDGHAWIVDPLDGTTNYAHAYPHFAVSIALVEKRQVVLGVVYDPMRQELFVAERGHGATLNGELLRVSPIQELRRSLLATGFAYDLDQREENRRLWDAFMPACQGVRRDGAAALNLCYVAAGRLDAFWERPLQPWDVSAGALLVAEAGGTVSGFGEAAFDPFAREVVASNGLLHAAMQEVIDSHRDRI